MRADPMAFARAGDRIYLLFDGRHVAAFPQRP
jgi:hypothetical protein